MGRLPNPRGSREQEWFRPSGITGGCFGKELTVVRTKVEVRQELVFVRREKVNFPQRCGSAS